MINFSEAAAIALHSLIYTASKKDKIISLKEISNRFDISEHHLSKVLQRLVKAGYLSSIKGPKGGFQIVKGKKDSTFLDVYETIEGKFIKKECLFAAKSDGSCCCIMSSLLQNLNNEFEKYMKEHKINDFTL